MLTLTCEYCGNTFTAEQHRRCCSRSHAAKLRERNRANGVGQRRDAWRPEEIAVLERWAGSKPVPQIIKILQRLQKENGWRLRSPDAVKSKIERLGLPLQCIDDNLTQTELANILRLPRHYVREWGRRHGLKIRKVSTHRTAIALADFRKWAASNKDRLAGCDRTTLLYLLDDVELVEAIKAIPPRQNNRGKRVLNLQTGIRYPSATAAAAAHYIDRTRITAAASRGSLAAGCRWKYVD